MQSFEQGRIQYSKNNFHKALAFYERALNEDELSEKVLEFVCDRIIELYQILKKKLVIEFQFKIAKKYQMINCHEKAAMVYHQIYVHSHELYFLFLECECLLEEGNLEVFKKRSEVFVAIAVSKKESQNILEFVDKFKEILNVNFIHSSKIKSYAICGDKHSLESLLGELDYSVSSEVGQSLINSTWNKTHYWHESTVIRNFIWNCLKNDDFLLTIPKKTLIKLVTDMWINENTDQDLMAATVHVCRKYDLAHVGYELAIVLGDRELASSFRTSMNFFEAEDSYDFGNDLLDEIDDREEVKKLENRIKLFSKAGNKEKADQLLEQLKKLDPMHRLINNRDTKVNTIKKSDDLYQSLMGEIDKYSTSENNDLKVNDFKKIVKFWEQGFIDDNYEDLIVTFKLNQMPEVAIEVINRVDQKSLEQNELINLFYLEAESYFVYGDYYRVRDLVSDVVENYPLIERELIPFMYLKAEAYFHLGYATQAQRLYLKIKSNTKHFRLTEERLRELEKNE